MPIKLPTPRRKTKVSTTRSSIPLIIAVILGIWVGLISVSEPNGQAWASLTAPFR